MISQHITVTAFANKLTSLKQVRFSGRLLLKGPLGQDWTLYLYLGRILYATGGVHPVKRWQRNLLFYCLNQDVNQLTLYQKNLETDLAGLSTEALAQCWEYQILCLWLHQQHLSREQIVKMIQVTVIEVLFDVNQALHVTYELVEEPPLTPQLVLIDAEQALAESHKIWNSWKTANISDLFPDQAPIIKQPELLQEKTSPAAYKSLTVLLNGQRTLRDIAVQTKRNVTDVTRSLLPYISAGWVELVSIPDVPIPITFRTTSTPPPPKKPQVTSQGPLIACVDDSPLVCQTMEKILTAVGYRFLGVQDSMRAIAMLLSRKPELIFLDLVMPHTNGYEICTQLRKVSAFRETPIIILTGNDGIIDRVRAKVVGASDFLGKPVDAETVLGIAHKYLKDKNTSIVVE